MSEMVKKVQEAINRASPIDWDAQARAAIAAIREHLRMLVNEQGYSQFEILHDIDAALEAGTEVGDE